MADIIETVNKVDPVKVFTALAKIYGNRAGVDVTLDSLWKKEGTELKKVEIKKTEEGGPG